MIVLTLSLSLPPAIPALMANTGRILTLFGGNDTEVGLVFKQGVSGQTKNTQV